MTDALDLGTLVGDGVVTRRANGDVAAVVERLLELLRERDVEVFAVIDHSGAAARVGQELRETKLVVFGNPAVGPELMQAAPLAGLGLPLKILVWADGDETLVRSNADAHIETLKAGHLSLITRPEAVTKVILDAVAATF